MGKSELGQVVDREGLDASIGSRGRVRLEIPSAWARDGGDIEVTMPTRITCARCDGGGCDSCARSGAHRTPDEPAERTLRLRLHAERDRTVTLRLVRPFGDKAPLEQLLVELSVGISASPGVTRIEPPPGSEGANASRLNARVLLAIAAAIAAVATAIGVLANQ